MESSSTCLKETGRRVRASDNYSPVCDTDTVASCHWQPLDPISEADPLSTSVKEARYTSLGECLTAENFMTIFGQTYIHFNF